MTSACPSCHQPLIDFACADIALRRCWGGHGVWIDNVQSARLASGDFPPEVVAELSKLEAHSPRRNEAHPAGACPECGDALQTFFVDVGQVAVDVCKRHGTWLDAGELARIARGEVAAHPAPPAAPVAATAAKGPRLREQLLARLASEAADGDGSQFHPFSRKVAEAFAVEDERAQRTVVSLLFAGVCMLFAGDDDDDDD